MSKVKQQTEQAPPQVSQFIEGSKDELNRITWPTTEELIRYTQIVVSATFVVGLLLYVTDLSIRAVLYVIGNILTLITG